ncbi:MAG: hypothetical protein AAB472_02680 [Patescibacteria group bacterium]
MKKFIVMYLAPSSVLKEWMQTPEAERKAQEEKMQSEWKTWMREHADMFDGMTAGVGATKLVTADAVTDSHNDIMLYSIVKGESQDEVAQAFVGHPHFGIPKATIQVCAINPLPGME